MQRFNETEGYNPRESNVLRMLGYFSLIGLQRVHTLVGDYHGALKAIHPLNLFEVGSHARSLSSSPAEAAIPALAICRPVPVSSTTGPRMALRTPWILARTAEGPTTIDFVPTV